MKRNFPIATGHVRLLALVSLALPLTLRANEPAEPKIRIGATVEISRSHSDCWFPTIHRFHSGEILVGMLLSPDQAVSERVFSAYCICQDGGCTRSRRYTMGHEAGQGGAWSETPDAADEIWHFGCHPESVQAENLKDFYNGTQHVADKVRKFTRVFSPAWFYRNSVQPESKTNSAP